MIRGLFITGTDTGVGKTVVAAALMHRYRQELPLRYWKPIQTGIEQEDDTAVVRTLGKCTDDEILDEGVRLKRPLSPHLSAKLSGKKISIEQVYRTSITHANEKVGWIVEGAGGALVPINDSEQMADLARMLSLPVLVVASTRLGTINHTLLTLEALRRRALIISGVVMIGERNAPNREAVESHGAVSVLGEMPLLADLNAATVARWAKTELDEQSVLLDHFRVAHHQTMGFRP
jgi:dethiobiotin synthetase